MQHREPEAIKHTRIARRFIQAAETYLNDGDVIQASEKIWGATAHAIKVFCISRGWRHGRYAHLRGAMRRLDAETGGNYWSDGFKVAYRNHLNFYNDDKNPSDVDQDRLAIRELVDRLLAAAGQNPLPPAG